MLTAAIVLGIGVGVLLGLLGGGGSLLAVPLLIHGLGLSPGEAVPAALLAVGLASLGAAAVHARTGGVDVASALPFLLLGSAASVLGARASLHLGARAQALLFAAVTAVAGIRLLRTAPAAEGPFVRSWGRIAAAALGAGFLTGLLGVGGGFILVPALTLAAGLPHRRAVGTSLLVLGVTALAGFWSHRALGAPLAASAPAFTAAAGAAALPAAFLASRVPHAALRRAFALLLLLVSVVTAGSAPAG